MEEKKEIEKYLLRLLARKDYSVNQLKQKCLLKKYSSHITEEVINSFKDRSYICEERYARSYIKAQFKMGRSIKLIAQELHKQDIHIAPNQIINYLENTADAYQEIRMLLKRKLKNIDTNLITNDYQYRAKNYQKLMRMAASRGFSFSEAQFLVNELLD
jgi:SOS response regulatory protein OraA/RecX